MRRSDAGTPWRLVRRRAVAAIGTIALITSAGTASGCRGEESAPQATRMDTVDDAPPGSLNGERPLALDDLTGRFPPDVERVNGVSTVDYDVDGWPDLTLGALSGPVLLRNRRNGTFEPDTQRAGLVLPNLVATAAPVWFDMDDDGDLDLFFAVM